MPCGASVQRIPLVPPGSCWKILLLASLAGAAVALPVLADEIYRWVDAEGRVHFGDKPPENAERVELTPVPAGDPQLQQRQEREERLTEIMAEDRLRRDQERRTGAQADADRRSNCETARKRNSQAADANYILRPTSDPNNPYYLTDAERLEFEQQLQAEIRRYCGKAVAPE